MCLRFGLSWRRVQRIRDVASGPLTHLDLGRIPFSSKLAGVTGTILSVRREPARVASLAADCRQSHGAKGVRTRVDRHAVAYDLEHHLIAGQPSLASALTHSASYQCCRRSLPPPQTSRRSFAGCRVQSLVSSASELRREDKCELGLLLQRSESQRWPAPNSNSRLIACIAGPAIRASAPMVLHTSALVEHRSGTLTPPDLIPVTNTIERPNKKFKRRIKIRPFVISGRHGNIVLGCSPPAR